MPDVRLIDANAVSKTLRNLPFGYTQSFAGRVAIEEIENALTIDAVPVVRCRECKYYNRALQLCNNGLGARTFEFYCADGAKMDGGADNG